MLLLAINLTVSYCSYSPWGTFRGWSGVTTWGPPTGRTPCCRGCSPMDPQSPPSSPCPRAKCSGSAQTAVSLWCTARRKVCFVSYTTLANVLVKFWRIGPWNGSPVLSSYTPCHRPAMTPPPSSQELNQTSRCTQMDFLVFREFKFHNKPTKFPENCWLKSLTFV